MEEMRVYIANLGKYNEGELVGAWFEPPIDMDEVRERIGLNEQYEEYAIHDFELPFEIGEYTPIEEINACVKWWRTCRTTFGITWVRCSVITAAWRISANTRTILSCGAAVTQRPMWRSRC